MYADLNIYTLWIAFGNFFFFDECQLMIIYAIQKKANIRNRYNQVPNLTQDNTWESDYNTRKHHIQESQEASLFPGGDHKAAMD